MIYTSKFLSKARLEFLEAWIWYEERQPGLGDRFKEEIFKSLYQIEQNPESYPVRKKPFHEKKVDVFPYIVIYRLMEKEKLVVIVSVFHAKRHPGRKYK